MRSRTGPARRALSHAAVTCVLRRRRLRAAIAGIAVHVDICPRWGPGLVRLEGVDDERERLLRCRSLERPRRAAEGTSGPGAGLVAPVAAGCEVAPLPLHGEGRAQLGDEPVVQVGSRDAFNRRIAPEQPADLAETVEAVPERLVQTCVSEERVVRDVPGPVARALQLARERGVVAVDRPPARRAAQAGIAVPVPEGPHAPAHQDRAPRRDGRHGLGVEAREPDPARGERVDVRGLRPAAVGARCDPHAGCR